MKTSIRMELETQRIEAVLMASIAPIAEMALTALLALKEQAGAAWPDESERTLRFVRKLAPKRETEEGND